jgi:hypothetical protein
MNAKSYNHYIEVIAYDDKGNKKHVQALYIVAVPVSDAVEREIDFKCYRPTYMPKNIVEKIGQAYGVAVEFDIKNPEKYDILGYRPDLDLYVFKEGLSFEEGLKKIDEIILDHLKEENFNPVKIENIPV